MMNVTQTVLNAITVGQLVVGIGSATLGEGVVAEDGLHIMKSEKVAIGDYVRWACAGDESITVAVGEKPRLYKTTPPGYDLAICKTAQTDGDLVVICRTARFEGSTKGWAERAAVRNAITHCRQAKGDKTAVE